MGSEAAGGLSGIGTVGTPRATDGGELADLAAVF